MTQEPGISALILDPKKDRLYFDDTGYALFMKPRDLEEISALYIGGRTIDELVSVKNLEVSPDSKVSFGVKLQHYPFPVNPEELRTCALILLYEQASIYARNANSPGVKIMDPATPELLRVQKDDGINYHAIATFSLLRPRENFEDMDQA